MNRSPLPADIELRLVDPAKNRRRIYGLTEGRTLFGEPCLAIAWGRIGHKLKTRTEIFGDEHSLDRRRRALLGRRHRKGYSLT
jgi:predicted DNA-binding WGR domain protein